MDAVPPWPLHPTAFSWPVCHFGIARWGHNGDSGERAASHRSSRWPCPRRRSHGKRIDSLSRPDSMAFEFEDFVAQGLQTANPGMGWAGESKHVSAPRLRKRTTRTTRPGGDRNDMLQRRRHSGTNLSPRAPGKGMRPPTPHDYHAVSCRGFLACRHRNSRVTS